MDRQNRTSWRLGLPVAAFAAILTVMVAPPAKAEIDYPYCLRAYIRGGSYDDCSYSTYAQCKASASGRSAECFRDPFYAGAPGTPYVVKKPRYPYSPFGSNIDPNYDPYRNWDQQQAPAHQKKRHRKSKAQ